MSREDAAYGITTFNVVLAADELIGFSIAPMVVYSQIRHIAGGSLIIGSLVTGQSLSNVGALIPEGAAAAPTTVWGPAGFALVAGGETTVASVIQGISQGFSGYASSNVY